MNALTNIALTVVLAAAGGAASLAVNGGTAAAAQGPVTVTGARDAIGEPVLLETFWVMEAVVEGDVVTPLPALPQRYLVVRGVGKFEAYDGCNWIMGLAAVKGDVITLADVGMTKRFCPNDDLWVEMKVLDTLNDGDVTYQIEGGRLELGRPDGAGLRLRAETPPTD